MEQRKNMRQNIYLLSITLSYSADLSIFNKSVSEFLHLERKVLLQVKVFLSVVLHRHLFQSNKKCYQVIIKTFPKSLCDPELLLA